MGIFWSDYTEADNDGDSVGDTLYTFTGRQGNLPLIPLKIFSIDPAIARLTCQQTRQSFLTFNENIFADPGYNNITVKMSNGTAKSHEKEYHRQQTL